MASPQENVSMAVFCDFENVALGVRDAKIDRFDIKPVLERLLLKGSIVVKKAYCDWDRYKGFKASMHEASFELIEIPHVRQSGKNSADIRLVVDALDLCYTKSHVDTFVIVSGDSDFSPLVSKLRENAKKVIGVGVKHSTSDLLVANCDEFIFYDDLVRELAREQKERAKARGESGANAKRQPGDDRRNTAESAAESAEERGEERKSKAITLVVETLDALGYERGDSGKIWASVLKSAIKRRRPDFNEARYGFRAFGNLLDEAQARGLLEVGRDEKSGTYVTRTSQPASAATSPVEEAPAPRADESRSRRKGRRGGRGAAAAGENGHEQERETSDLREVREAQETAEAHVSFEFEQTRESEASAAMSNGDLFTETAKTQSRGARARERAREHAHGHAHEHDEARHAADMPLFGQPPHGAHESTAGGAPAEAHQEHQAHQAPDAPEAPAAPRRARKTASRKSAARKKAAPPAAQEAHAEPREVTEPPAPEADADREPARKKAKAPKKTTARARRPRKAPEES
ncbi:NYN domain-containing protein [Paraburkholderia silviterrae]|uniref:NYN domain-containing protein n=1 Tax=Paraburkholderia silviterrae TaxID=2528715 RepID=A0A4V2ZZF5_9BURK|nr:NYN domain-containing protein [Paraburkholderia silviterrae]TDG25151.1 NYN domain-containing protein [Paraburkholderia silviterrae]